MIPDSTRSLRGTKCKRRLHLEKVGGDLVCDVSRVTEPDLGTVAALARLQVHGRGLAWTVRLRHASPRLRELLDLCGLAGILAVCQESPLVDQGQPEQGESAEAIIEYVAESAADMAVAQLRVLGGAVATVPGDATAYVHRDRRIMANVAAMFSEPAETSLHEERVDRLVARLRRDTDGVYVNFLGEEGEARVREAYPGPTWERLREVKRRYDPTNLFHLNQNIPPAS